MAKGSRGKAGNEHWAKPAIPARIPDTPENVSRSLLNTPPKKPAEWDYLRKPGRTDGKDGWNCAVGAVRAGGDLAFEGEEALLIRGVVGRRVAPDMSRFGFLELKHMLQGLE